MEGLLHLMMLEPRHSGFSLLSYSNIDERGTRAPSDAKESCWNASLARDIQGFGHCFRKPFEETS